MKHLTTRRDLYLGRTHILWEGIFRTPRISTTDSYLFNRNRVSLLSDILDFRVDCVHFNPCSAFAFMSKIIEINKSQRARRSLGLGLKQITAPDYLVNNRAHSSREWRRPVNHRQLYEYSQVLFVFPCNNIYIIQINRNIMSGGLCSRS